MFNQAKFLSLTLIAAAIAAVYWLNIHLKSEDAPAYKKLIQESMELRSRHALERQPAHQIREGVQKDIWALSGDQRLHFRLKSGQSELTLTQKKGKVDAVEKLRQIDCWIQDEIDPEKSMQQVRTLTADEGIYYFPSHRFLAEAVHLAFFHLPGIELPLSVFPEKPFLTGIAREVSFTTTGKLPTFTAYHLQAQIELDKGLP